MCLGLATHRSQGRPIAIREATPVVRLYFPKFVLILVLYAFSLSTFSFSVFFSLLVVRFGIIAGNRTLMPRTDGKARESRAASTSTSSSSMPLVVQAAEDATGGVSGGGGGLLPTHSPHSIKHRSDSHGHHSRPTNLAQALGTATTDEVDADSDSEAEEYESRTSNWHHHDPSSSGKVSQWRFLSRRISFVHTAIMDFIHSNQGLLLIVASQLFFAFMNLGVKFLAGLSQPVPTFEVGGHLLRAVYILLNICSSRLYSLLLHVWCAN